MSAPLFPVPLKPLGDQGREDLCAILHGSPQDSIEQDHALACLWLNLCHMAGHNPDDTKTGRPFHGSIRSLWAPVAAVHIGHCPSAMSAHRAAPAAAQAAVLFHLALDARATAGVNATALFEV